MSTLKMRAGIATEGGVAVRDIARPQPSEDQILVRVAAAGLNRADLATAKAVPAPNAPPMVVGMEWAGEVVETGARVTGLKPGDHVMCSGSGGYAEYAVTDAGRAMAFDPQTLDVKQAAVLPLALLTAHDALITHGQIKTGDAVLINGATSAVGLMLLQLARLKGARLVAATARDASKQERLRPFGMTHFFSTGAADWADELLKVTDNRGVDVAVDMVSGDTVNPMMKATRVLGRIVNVGRLGGNSANFNFDLHALRRITYEGVTFRTRSMAEIRDITSRMRAGLWSAVMEKRLLLPIDHVFKLDDAAAAHGVMSANRHFGKIVLTA